jgi:hypothetical protein
MEKLKHIKKCLVNCVEEEMEKGLHNVDTEELGEAIDMIKDMEEAMYYHSIVKAVEEADGDEYIYPHVMYRGDMSETSNVMTYQGMYTDYREGKSHVSRKHYMESKEMHHDKEETMKELQKYTNELTDDILEMIVNATPEEKAMLSQKLTLLAERVK